MNKNLTFVGLVDKEEIEASVSGESWKSNTFVYPPYRIIRPMPTYMFTLGSGNLSLPTIAYNFKYISGLDVFRHDFRSLNPDEPLINIDHYIAGSISPNTFAVFQTPPQIYHWPSLDSDILKNIDPEWKFPITEMLKKSKI